MELTERKKIILQSVIDAYISTAEPVGSKVLAEKINLSSATIRNELADLESMGLLIQPHTSAGRIPTQAGYRYYVDSLMRAYLLPYEEMQSINNLFRQQLRRMEHIVEDAGKLISRLTPYTAVALTPVATMESVRRFEILGIDERQFVLVAVMTLGDVKNMLCRVQKDVQPAELKRLSTLLNARFTDVNIGGVNLMELTNFKKEMGELSELAEPIMQFLMALCQEAQSCEVYLEGQNNIFNFPEYQDVGKAKEFFDFISDKAKIAHLVRGSSGGVRIIIGNEIEGEGGMDNLSLVVSDYQLGDQIKGSLGILGPSRMNYSRAVSHIEYFTDTLNKILSRLYGFED